MVFTKDSALVKIWVSVILAGLYTVDQCPKLFNLATVVAEVIGKLTE